LKKQIIPAVCEYSAHLARDTTAKKAVGDFVDATPETELLMKLSNLNKELYTGEIALEEAVKNVPVSYDEKERAEYYRDSVFAKMQSLRGIIDEIEPVVPKTIWPVPTYSDLLFYC